jgi:hypothetical protein
VNTQLTPDLIYPFDATALPHHLGLWKMAGPKAIGPAVRDLLSGAVPSVAFVVCVHLNPLCGGEEAGLIKDVVRLAYVAIDEQMCMRDCGPAFDAFAPGAYTIYCGQDVTEATAVITYLLYQQVFQAQLDQALKQVYMAQGLIAQEVKPTASKLVVFRVRPEAV